jgi:hypothetical protein
MLGFAEDADAIPTLTIPSIKQDIAAAVIAIFLIISILFLVQSVLADFF